MTNSERFYEKLELEYDSFIDELKGKTPDEILVAAYEKVSKEKILNAFDNSFYSEEEYGELLKTDNLLESIYREFLDLSVDDMEDIENLVCEVVERKTKQIGEIEETVEAAEVVESSPPLPIAEVINGKVEVGDWVIVKPDEDYGCLVGRVTAIDKVGTEEHDTDNPGDDIHVDFVAVDYSESAKSDFMEAFDHLKPDATGFDDLPLDDVIMAPESLISLVGLDFDHIGELSASYKAAYEFGNNALSNYFNDRESELIDRVEQNYTDWSDELETFSKSELIDMAGKISAMRDAYEYMTASHGFSDEEIDFYLQFQSPLEVLADAWRERTIDLSDMSFAMDDIMEHQAKYVAEHALMSDDEPKDANLRRFMNVDVVDFLDIIARKTLLNHKNDWNIDKDELFKAAQSDDPNDRRLIWHVCSMATHIKRERDVYVRDSGAYQYMTDYRQNDPDMFGYVIEVTGSKRGAVIGNIFEVGDYAKFAEHIRATAHRLDSVTLTYSKDWGVNAGQTITVSRREYDDDRHRLMCDSGSVTTVTFNPPDEALLAETLAAERNRRMSFPQGSYHAHLQKFAEQLKEARKPPEQAQSTPKKRSIEERLKEGNEKAKAHKSAPNNTKKHEEELG